MPVARAAPGGWSRESSPTPSVPTPLLPEGGARFEVHFAADDPVGGAWEGSLAQRFQSEAAKQMAVAPTSLKVVERYGGGGYLLFDLLPLELQIEPLTSRLLAALHDYPELLGAAQLRRVLPAGRDELLWEARSGGGARRAGGGLGTLGLVVLLPAKEFTIKHGPKRTVLYWLCRNVEFAETINGFLEGEPWSFAYLQHQINQQLVCVTLM